jgi:hypothetical protein
MKVPYNYNRKSSITVYDPWGDDTGHHYADEVFVSDKPTHSLVLGPDGKPFEYEPPIKMGFHRS